MWLLRRYCSPFLYWIYNPSFPPSFCLFSTLFTIVVNISTIWCIPAIIISASLNINKSLSHWSHLPTLWVRKNTIRKYIPWLYFFIILNLLPHLLYNSPAHGILFLFHLIKASKASLFVLKLCSFSTWLATCFSPMCNNFSTDINKNELIQAIVIM